MSETTSGHLTPMARRSEVSAGPVPGVARSQTPGWEYVVLLVGIAAAALAVWVTLRADFLEHPGWLAVQKADLILGPIGVGLYWHHKRPGNRLGLLLIALGLVAIPYVMQSTSWPWPYTIGTAFEYVIEPLTLAVILAFPNGRLGRVEWAILSVMLVCLSLVNLLEIPIIARFPPYFSISGCRASCPANPSYSSSLYASTASWVPAWTDVERLGVIIPSLAAVGLLAWRFLTGTPPRRRALAIGAPIAMCFLVAAATYQIVQLVNPDSATTYVQPATTGLQWVVAVSRSAVWYGFLFALIAAELYAGRVLRRLNRDSLGRPTFRQLEGLLRGPLGDPGLRLGFWRTDSTEWVDADGGRLAPPDAGQDATEVDRDERAVISIVHDQQLSEDPELLQAAGAVALMALENAELEAAWHTSLDALEESRRRLAEASDHERRKLERDLHDGAQQRLTAIQIRLNLATEEVENEPLAEELADISGLAAEAIEELRMLSHGIYPTVLRVAGPVSALRSLALRTTTPIVVTDQGIGRCPSAVEAAIYFCCAEAIQNATKHAGGNAQVTVNLGQNHHCVHFTVSDNGIGMPEPTAHTGDGLTGMRDRISAVGGTLEITSTPGQGTTVRGSIPTTQLPAQAAES